MSGATLPTAVLGLDLSAPWQQRPAQTYLLSGSGGGRGSRTPLRLPALPALSGMTSGAHRRSSMARLSISEPSLLTTNDSVLFEGFHRRPSLLQRRAPPPPPLSKSSVLLPCRNNLPHQQQIQSCSRPAFLHFSKAIQPSVKPRPVRRHSHNPVLSTDGLQADLKAAALKSSCPPSHRELLSVVGKHCLLSCSERPAQAAPSGPARTQLHVFLPSEAEGEEADSESVDEGFMDEMDSKITSVKLQQGTAKKVTL